MKKYVLLFFVVCFGIQPGYAIDPDYFKQMMWAATSTMCNAVWNFGKSYAGHAVSICSLGMAGYAIKQTRNMRNELGEEQKKYNSLEGALAEKASADRIVALEKALAEKASADRIVALEKALAEKASADRIVALEKALAEKASADRIVALEKALAEKASADRIVALEKALAEKASADRIVALEKALAEKASADRIVALEKALAEKASADRIVALEKALAEKASADRIVALEQALAEKADTNKIVALEKALAEKSGADQRKFLLLNIAVKTMGENIAANKSALADMNNELSTSYLVIEGTYESVFALIHQFLRMTPSSVSSEEFHEFKRGFSRFKKECALQASVTREKAKQTTMNQLKKKIEFVYHIYDKDLQKYDHKIRSLKQAMT